MGTFNGTNNPDIYLGTSGDDVVTNIGVGLDVITTGFGNDTVTVIPDGGGLLDLLPDIIAMGPGDDDLLIVDNRGSAQRINMGASLLDLSQGGLGGAIGLNGLERITFSGVDRFTIYGGTANDVIVTGGADDLLNGGAGADSMSGGLGNDTYAVDNVDDMVIEAVNGGNDRVVSTIDYVLGDNIENLSLSGTDNIDATGNAGSNVLTGNSGNNILNGGRGADAMTGGAGNDTYYVDSSGDTVTEGVNGGIDTVFSTTTFRLEGGQVENLTLVGTLDRNAFGNELNNVLIGNSGDNILFGGAGNDRMEGGLGDDSYYVDSTRDIVEEDFDQGVDTVFSTVTYRLQDNVENLSLIGNLDRAAVGNDLDNKLFGNVADNQLSGGLGADILTGGGGVDRFDYNSVDESTMDASDRITDLVNTDYIDLSGIDANTTKNGGQAFTLVDSFTNHAGELTIAYSASTNLTTVLADVNGDGVADMRILINGDHHDFTNFVL